MSDPKAKETPLMEKITSLCKRRGYIYQSSEIYGGIGGFWDYGPLGAELKRNLREAWWVTMTRQREDVLGLDATIIMHPAIWKASGHVDTFADLMRECIISNKRVRADHVDPSFGVAMFYDGATSPTGWKYSRPFSALIKKGEHIDSFRKRIRVLLAQNAGEAAGASEAIELLGETKGDVLEGSVDFHPETTGALNEARPFNLMLSTLVGPTATEENRAYLRPETAQAIFVQFKNVFDSSRIKVPFGICQIGKAFRNEVTPKNFTFRSREFEQMELEFFIAPDEAIELMHGSVAQWSETADLSEPQPNWGWEMWHRYWVDQRTKFYATIGLGRDVLEYYWQEPADLAHYARACVDILFKFPFGTEELEGIAARGNFDLSQHQEHSGKFLEVFDDELRAAAAKLSPEEKEAFSNKVIDAWEASYISKGKDGIAGRTAAIPFVEKLLKGNYLPHVIEPSAGLDRLALAVISNAFVEEEKTDVNGKKEMRTFLRIHPSIAPVKCGVFPLLKNRPEQVAKAREVYAKLKKHFHCFYDEGGNIGRRYARQDEVGTPFGVTIDFETLGEKGPELADTVTVRERDSGAQTRVKIDELAGYLLAKING